MFYKDPFLVLYFSLFINDFPASLPSISCSPYADDLAIWSSSPSVPDREGEESQGERELHLCERRRLQWEHEEERVETTVKEGRFQGGEGGQARRAFLGAG